MPEPARKAMTEFDKAEDRVASWEHIVGLSEAMCVRDIALVFIILWLIFLTWTK